MAGWGANDTEWGAGDQPVEDFGAGDQEWGAGDKPVDAPSAQPFMPSHKPVGEDPYERARLAEEARVEAENLKRREERGIGKARQTVEGGALSILSGGVGLAEIPGALAKAQAGIARKAVRAVGGEKAAETFGKIQPYIPAAAGGSLGVAPVQEQLAGARQALREAAPVPKSPVIKDPRTGEEFLNRDVISDPNFWINIVGEEAAPMAVQIALAKMSGGASAAVSPALVAKLEKAGKVGSLALKFLRSRAGSKIAEGTGRMVGFEAARTLPEAQTEAKRKYMATGDSEAVAEEKAATWGSVSAGLQGAVGGVLETKILNDALTKKARSLIGKGLGYIGTAIKEGGEEALQSLVGSAVNKMSSDPNLTLDQALRAAAAEGIGGAGVGLGMRAATFRARMGQPEVEPTPAPEVAPEPTAFREATPEEAARVGQYDPLQLAPEDEAALAEVMQPGGEISRQYPDVPPPSAGEAYAKTILQERGNLEREARIAEQGATAQEPTREALLGGMTEQDEALSGMSENRQALQQQLDNAVAEIESGRTKDVIKAKRTADRLRNEILDLDIQSQMITQGISAEDADAMRKSTLEAQLAEAEAIYARTKSRKAKAEVERIQNDMANPDKWAATRTAWDDLKSELGKPGNERGAIGDQTNPEVFAKATALARAAIQDGYKNASEWLADLRNRMPDFQEFYQRIGGLRGAEELWASASSQRLTPGMSGTETLSNEELKRQGRGDTYYRVDRSGNVTRLGYQPDAPVRTGEAILMVDGATGKPQVQNSEGLGADQAVLAKFGPKVSNIYKETTEWRRKQTGAIGKDVSPQAIQRNRVATELAGPDKRGARSAAYSEVGEVVRPISSKETANIVARTTFNPGDLPLPDSVLKDINSEFRREYLPGTKFVGSPAVLAMRDRPMQEVLKGLRRFIATEERTLYEFGEAVAAWDSLDPIQSEALSAAWFYGTLADEGRGRVWSDAELDKFFPNMKPETKTVYRTVLKTINETTEELKKAEKQKFESQVRKAKALAETLKEDGKARVEEGIKNLKAAFDAHMAALSNKAYAPLRRFGSHKMTVNDAEGKRLGVVHIDLKPSNAIGAKSHNDTQIRRGLMRIAAQNPEARTAITNKTYSIDPIVALPKMESTGPGIPDPSLLAYMTAAKDIDPSLLSELEITAMNAYLSDSFKARYLERQGIPGYDMDGLKVLKHHAHSIASRIANLKHSDDISEAMKGMSQKARGTKYDPVLEKETREIVEAMYNPSYNAVVNMLTTLAFVSDIGAKLSFVAQNLIQQPTMGGTVLGNFYGWKEAASAYTIGNRIAKDFLRITKLGGIDTYTPVELSKKITKSVTKDKFRGRKDAEGLETIIRAVLEQSAKDGELRPKVSMELMAKRDTEGLSKAEAAMSQVAEYVGYFAAKSEQQNRIATVVAAAVLAHDHGVVEMGEGGWTLEKIDTKKDATNVVRLREFAEFMNQLINFAAGKGNMAWYQRQKHVGSFLRLPMQYQRFAIDQAMVLHNLGILNGRNMTDLHGRDTTKAKRLYDRIKPQLMSAAVVTLFGGASAIPAWLVLSSVLKAFLGPWYEAFIRDVREFFIIQGEEVAKKAGMTEQDGRRMGLKTAFSLENGITNMLPEGYAFNLNAALAPSLLGGRESDPALSRIGGKLVGSMGSKAIKFGEDVAGAGMLEPEALLLALKRQTPPAVKGAQEALSGEVKIDSEGLPITPAERAMRLFSLTPTSVSMRREGIGEKYDQSRARRDLEEWLTRYWRENYDKNPDKTHEFVSSKAQAFEAKYPDVKYNDIVRSVRKRAMKSKLGKVEEEKGLGSRK